MLVFATLCVFAGRSSATEPLLLEHVTEAARERYPLVLAAAREVSAAKGNLQSAEGGFDPVWRSSAALEATGKYPTFRAQTSVEQPTPLWGATAFAGYRIGGGTFADYDKKALTNEFGEVRAGVRVPVLRDGPIDRRRASIAQQELSVAAAIQGKRAQEFEAVRLASNRYWDWVATGFRLRAFKDWLQLAESRDSQLADRVKRGEIPEIERIDNTRTILQRKNVVVQAERDLSLAAQELSLFLRASNGEVQVPDTARLPTVMPAVAAQKADGPAVEQDALARRPDLRRSALQIDRLNVEVDFASNQRYPGLDVSIAASRDFGMNDPGLNKPVLEAFAVLDVPILNRPARGRLEAAEQDRARANLQLKLQRERVLADIRGARIALNAAKERAELASKEYVLAKQLATAEVTRFDLGESTLLAVNLREQASAEANIRSIDAETDHRRAIANYTFATSGL
jgi:outer membrane protein, heavy metal efflux system